MPITDDERMIYIGAILHDCLKYTEPNNKLPLMSNVVLKYKVSAKQAKNSCYNEKIEIMAGNVQTHMKPRVPMSAETMIKDIGDMLSTK
jgi:hypothetical protein